MKHKKGGISTGALVAVIFGILVVAGLAWYAGNNQATGIVDIPNTGAKLGDNECKDLQCFQNPSYTYSAFDVFSNTAIGGTDEIKVNGKNPVSSLASPAKCDELQYWKNNASVFCELSQVEKVECGAHQVQTKCYQNSTSTLVAYDQFTALTSGGGANNITIAANGLGNVDYVWQGEAKKAAMPFGGCMVVEYPSTMSSVTPSGEGLSTTGCEHALTYTVSSTSNTYKVFAVPKGFDAAGLGDKKEFTVQYKAGSTDPAGTAIVTFYPANYYVGDDGKFYLGVEKDKNSDTTKTFASNVAFTIGIV